MNFAAIQTTYAADGFVVVRGFLPPDELTRLQENLDRYIREVVPTLPDAEAFYEDKSRPDTLKQLHRMEQDAFFADYRQHPLWLAAAEALLGEPPLVLGVEWFNKPPSTPHITPPHQDNFYFCLTPPKVLTMWLALDAIDEENGCLRYVRGSHQPGVRPHSRTQTLGFSQGISDYGEADRQHEVPIHAQPGDLLIHHGNTIHRADANRSATRHRRSFALVFKAPSCRRDEDAFRRYSQAAQAQHQQLGLKTQLLSKP